MPEQPVLLYVVNNPAFFVSHRLSIAEAAMQAGYQVHIACPEGAGIQALKEVGMHVHVWQLSRKGLNPINELASIVSLYRLYRKLKPALVHHITPKPNLYGGIAARMAHVPARVFAVAGMGHMFVSQNIKQVMLRPLVGLLYRLAFRGKNLKVIVQNKDDFELIKKLVQQTPDAMELIPGSGVNLDKFQLTREPSSPCVVVMASRLFRDKGVREFIQAARILKSRNINARFVLAGEPDEGNPESISSGEISAWRHEGIVELPGFVPDIPHLYANAHIVVLPSYYREGLPKSLIEAAACGRAIVTTDMPGCRDAVLPEVSGILVPPRNAEKLADAIMRLIENNELRIQMGKAGRKLAEDRFSIEDVVSKHLGIYDMLMQPMAESAKT